MSTPENMIEDNAEEQEIMFKRSADWTRAELTKLIIDELKTMPDVWQKMNEDQQDRSIRCVDSRVKYIVEELVERIAANEFPIVKGKIDKVVFKGGIEAVVKMPSMSECRHELADAEGSIVSIIIAEPSQYTDSPAIVEADKDQPGLDIGEPEQGEQEGTLGEVLSEALAESEAVPDHDDGRVLTGD